MKDKHYNEIKLRLKQLSKFIETQSNVIFTLMEEIKELKAELDIQARKIAEANFWNKEGITLKEQ